MMKPSPLVGSDSHCHLSFLNDEKLSPIIEAYPNFHWIFGGYDSKDWKRQIEIKIKYPNQFSTCFGIHPWVIKQLSEENLKKEWEALLNMINGADFVGETGLDLYKTDQSVKKEIQIDFFKKHIDLAINKPLVLHVVKAHGETLETLDLFSKKRGWVHAFQGSLELVYEYNKRGFLVSFGRGLLNTKNAKLVETVQKAPMDGFILESDSPHSKGAIDNPMEIFQEIVTKVSTIRGVSEKELLRNNQINLDRIRL